MSDYSKLSEISINSEVGLPSSDTKLHIISNELEPFNGAGKDSPGNSGCCGTNPEIMSGCHVNVDASAAGSHSQTPIAICGMALRLPGALSTAQQYQDFLLAKGDARQRVLDSRYNVSAFHDPSGKPGTVTNENSYFLEEDIGCLDSSFFAMARMEVERLDPQQRLMLEVARECFDDAGVTSWRGKRIGCYMGSLFEDWCEMFARETQN